MEQQRKTMWERIESYLYRVTRPIGQPITEGWKTVLKTACRNAGLTDLHFHDLRHTFVTRKVREGWDYKHIMAVTGHKTFAVF